jgi:hypothetical protein
VADALRATGMEKDPEETLAPWREEAERCRKLVTRENRHAVPDAGRACPKCRGHSA